MVHFRPGTRFASVLPTLFVVTQCMLVIVLSGDKECIRRVGCCLHGLTDILTFMSNAILTFQVTFVSLLHQRWPEKMKRFRYMCPLYHVGIGRYDFLYPLETNE